ncbi:serine palmitoyltransferase 3 [Ditylenchus destructor]|nr:serine palmitoyltransferase 3 [Ditylenchus destructor]
MDLENGHLPSQVQVNGYAKTNGVKSNGKVLPMENGFACKQRKGAGQKNGGILKHFIDRNEQIPNGLLQNECHPESWDDIGEEWEYAQKDYHPDACPKTPLITAWLTNCCHWVLTLIAIVAEWLRYYDFIRNDWAQERPQQRDFAPLTTQFQAVFANNIYRKASDIMNRPIASVPGPVVTLKNRHTFDHGWTYV